MSAIRRMRWPHLGHATLRFDPGERQTIGETDGSTADATVVLIDVVEGVQAQNLSHLRLLNLMGIHRLVMVINKMDLLEFSEDQCCHTSGVHQARSRARR